MSVGCILENAGHVLILKTELFAKNVNLLSQFGINIKDCTDGKGAQVLGYLNLKEVLESIREMKYDDEVLRDKSNSLERIRAFAISMNYNRYKDSLGAQYVKGAI